MEKALFCLSFILLLSLFIGCSDDSSKYEQGYIRYNGQWITRSEYSRIKSNEQINNQTNQAPPATTQTSQNQEQSLIHQPIIFNGVDSKTTAPFTINSDEWIIEWNYSPQPIMPVFTVLIYPRGETVFYVKAIITETTNGYTYCYANAGEYYLDIAAANLNSWEIVIKPQ